MMAEDKSGFILYADLIHTVEQMPDELAGKLLKIILEYVNDRNPEIDDLLLRIAFEPIKRQLKRDLKSWESKRKKLSDAGKAGAEARWHKDKDDGQAMRSHTTASDSMASMAVTVTDTVTVTDIGEKRTYLDFIKLTESEYEKLEESIGNTTLKEYMNDLNNYIGSKGKKYKSHYHTILAWYRRDNPTAKKSVKSKSEYFHR